MRMALETHCVVLHYQYLQCSKKIAHLNLEVNRYHLMKFRNCRLKWFRIEDSIYQFFQFKVFLD